MASVGGQCSRRRARDLRRAGGHEQYVASVGLISPNRRRRPLSRGSAVLGVARDWNSFQPLVLACHAGAVATAMYSKAAMSVCTVLLGCVLIQHWNARIIDSREESSTPSPAFGSVHYG